jgi:hypothetical protein
MEITREAFEAATRRGKRLEAEYGATSVRYDQKLGMVRVALRSKKELRFYPSAIRGLTEATPDQLRSVELGPAGVSLYFPDVDVDLSIPGLVHDVDGRHIVIA